MAGRAKDSSVRQSLRPTNKDASVASMAAPDDDHEEHPNDAGGGSNAEGNEEWEGEEEVQYVLVDLSQAGGADLDEGAPYQLAGLHSEEPTLTLADGQTLAGQYEETVGSWLLFEDHQAPLQAGDRPDGGRGGSEVVQGTISGPGDRRLEQGDGEAPEGDAAALSRVHFLGHTDKLLVFRPRAADQERE